MQSSILALWLAEVSSLPGVDVFDESLLKHSLIPQIPSFRVKELIEDSQGFILSYRTSDSKTIPFARSQLVSEHMQELVCFTNEGEVSHNSDIPYVRSLYRLCKGFGGDSTFLALKGESVYPLDDRFTGVSKPKDSDHILFGIPVFGRYRVLKVLVNYLHDYLIPKLRWEGFEAHCVFVGEPEALELVKSLVRPGFALCVPCENNLGYKKNLIMRIAKDLGSSYLIWNDSDDFFSPSVILDLISLAKANGYWSAIEPFSFFDTLTKRMTRYPGYAQNHTLYQQGMGSGRVFTKHLMNSVEGFCFSQTDKGMDASVKTYLSKLSIPFPERLLSTGIRELPLGVKVEENIWPFEGYKGESTSFEEDSLSWLPKPIQEAIFRLDFDRP